MDKLCLYKDIIILYIILYIIYSFPIDNWFEFRADYN